MTTLVWIFWDENKPKKPDNFESYSYCVLRSFGNVACWVKETKHNYHFLCSPSDCEEKLKQVFKKKHCRLLTHLIGILIAWQSPQQYLENTRPQLIQLKFYVFGHPLMVHTLSKLILTYLHSYRGSSSVLLCTV